MTHTMHKSLKAGISIHFNQRLTSYYIIFTLKSTDGARCGGERRLAWEGCGCGDGREAWRTGFLALSRLCAVPCLGWRGGGRRLPGLTRGRRCLCLKR